MALASASTSGSVVRIPSWDEGLPKMCCRRTSKFGHICSQCSRVCGSSSHSGHVGSAAGSSEWAYALRNGMCPDRSRARRTEVAMQSAIQEKCSHTMAVRGLLDGGSVLVRRMRAFAAAAAFPNSSAASLPGSGLTRDQAWKRRTPSMLEQ